MKGNVVFGAAPKIAPKIAPKYHLSPNPSDSTSPLVRKKALLPEGTRCVNAFWGLEVHIWWFFGAKKKQTITNPWTSQFDAEHVSLIIFRCAVSGNANGLPLRGPPHAIGRRWRVLATGMFNLAGFPSWWGFCQCKANPNLVLAICWMMSATFSN